MRMLLALALAVSGCTAFSDRAPGCVAPPNEAALLDVLAAEPALGVVPPAVAKQSERERIEAVELPGDDEHVAARLHVGVYLTATQAVAEIEAGLQAAGC